MQERINSLLLVSRLDKTSLLQNAIVNELSLTFLSTVKSAVNLRLPVAAKTSYGAPAEKHPPQLRYWTVRSSRKSTGVIALSRTRFTASNTAACLSFSLCKYVTYR